MDCGEIIPADVSPKSQRQDDLKGLDIVNGQCYNASVPQNLTFSYQGLPFGLGKKSVAARPASAGLGSSAVLAALGVALLLGVS